MNMHTLNPWAILIAAISAFLLGGIWYAPPVFGKAWGRANGFAEEPPAAYIGEVFGISFILTLVRTFNLAMFLNNPTTNCLWGSSSGFLAEVAWAAMGLAIVSLFD